MHSILYVCMYIFICSEQQSRSIYIFFLILPIYLDFGCAHLAVEKKCLWHSHSYVTCTWIKPSRDSSGIRQFRKKKTVQVLVYGLDFFVVVVVCKCFFTSRRLKIVWLRLVQATSPQIIGYDDVSNGVKYKLDVISICCACLVTVDLLRWTLVLRFKLGLNVGSCLLISLVSCKNRAKNTNLK